MFRLFSQERQRSEMRAGRPLSNLLRRAVGNAVAETMETRRLFSVSVLGTSASAAGDLTSSLTISNVTVDAGSDRLLVVAASGYNADHSNDVSGITFNGQALTQAVAVSPGINITQDIWYLNLADDVAPTASDVVVTYIGPATAAFASATAFSGVDQTTPISATAASPFSGDAPGSSGVTLPSAEGDLVLDAITAFGSTVTPNSGQTSQATNTLGSFSQGVSTAAGAASVTMTWTESAPDFNVAHDGVNIKQTPAPPPPPPLPTISIDDVSKLEGNSGTQLFQFPVTRTSSLGIAAVDYVTVNDSANDIDDYNAASGSVFFNVGETTKYITVGVKGDNNFEPDQKFDVVLSNPLNATITNDTGVGTILNDDGPVGASINDVALVEGNSGTKNMVFTVKLSAANHSPTTIHYSTTAGTASSGVDFTAKTGTLVIPQFGQSATIAIPIIGDSAVEADESFTVKLTSISTGAFIADGIGVGTIVNDDFPPPTMTINDVATSEGTGAGFTVLTFTIKLSKAATGPVSVKYATANGTASSSSDYTSTTGTVTFTAGQVSKTISVQVKKDSLKETDETFFVNLTNLTGPAMLGDAQGKGTIKNDD